jgi:hypothetical protein
MTADINTINKIKKLLAVAQAGSGATENEAATAMEFASALMLKHNIEVQLDGDDEEGAIKGAFQHGYDEPWHIQCANAAGYLYYCRPLIYRRLGDIVFVGRADNITACEETLKFLTREVERLYKLNLPKGMSKIERANYRSTFKMACAMRLAARAWAIMETLRTNDAKAIAATGSKALVVVETIDAMLAEADAILGGMGVKTMTVRPRRAGLGTFDGRKAGDTVQLQKQVK